MRLPLSTLGAALSLSLAAQAAPAQQPPRDPFFWLGEINKATAVINTDEGLLDKSMAPRLAAGVAQVIRDGDDRSRLAGARRRLDRRLRELGDRAQAAPDDPVLARAQTRRRGHHPPARGLDAAHRGAGRPKGYRPRVINGDPAARRADDP